MKRLVPLLIFIIAFFTGCDVKNYTPEIPATLNQSATVSSGDFSFQCEICKNQEGVKVTVLSTEAKGMVMMYNGESLDFVYENYSHTVNAQKFERDNIAIVVYEVLQYINTAEQQEIKKIDGGYQYNGKISAGDFILIQNDDNTFNSIAIPSADFKITFEN